MIFAPEEIQIVYQKKLCFQNSGQALQEAAWGGGGVTVQDPWRCGIDGHGLVGWW